MLESGRAWSISRSSTSRWTGGSLHQPASIKFTGDSTIDPSMLYPLLLMIAAFYAVFTCCLLMNMRAERSRSAKPDQLGEETRTGVSHLMYFDSVEAALSMAGHGATSGPPTPSACWWWR